MSTKQSTKLHTLVFAGFLLLGILLRGADDMMKGVNSSMQTLLFIVQTSVFAGLILFWIQSLLRRMLPALPRTYMLAAGWSMMFLLLIRTVRYRLPMEPLTDRICWYLYYVPLILIAVLFLMCSISFSRTSGSGKERYLLLPSALLILGVLTNDLHLLAFYTDLELSIWIGKVGTYTYGPVYYLVCVWIGICIAGGVFFLIKTSRAMSDWKSAVVPLSFLILIPVLNFLRTILDQYGVYRFFHFPEIYIFCMMGVYESCIRNDLLPHNENYTEFFTQLSLPIVITDRHFTPVFTSGVPMKVSRQQLEAALSTPLYLDADTRLQGNVLRAGYTFWTEDESALHRLQEHLEDVNETLSMENTLLRYENEQKEAQSRIAARNAIYEQAAAQVHETHRNIAALLAAAQPGTAGFRELVAQVSIQNAYVKRKYNFVLSSQTLKAVDIRELYLALKEVTDFLGYCGILASVECRSRREIPIERAIAAFDTFACLLQELWERISLLLILVTENDVQMAVNCEPLSNPPQTPCSISQIQTEEHLRILIRLGKGETV